MLTDRYDRLVEEAMAAPVEGWDFGWLDGRAEGSEPSWSYPALARGLLAQGPDGLLDIDTGGGELLASLAELTPLPTGSWATEGWQPNIPVARRRLDPLGVTVLPAPDADHLPLPDAAVRLVLNRHGRLSAPEVARVLRPGGLLLTQQVGGEDCSELNTLLGAPRSDDPDGWQLNVARRELSAAGLRVTDAREERPTLFFHDIGAVVYQLRLVSWQIPDFGPRRYESALRRLHQRIESDGPLAVRTHRFLLQAVRRPSPPAP